MGLYMGFYGIIWDSMGFHGINGINGLNGINGFHRIHGINGIIMKKTMIHGSFPKTPSFPKIP